MKFKVGDKVRIRPDLDYVHSSGNLQVVEDMINSRGEVDTIVMVDLDHNDRAEYRLEEHKWIWNDNMLIPEAKTELSFKATDRPKQRFKVGDKVRLKSGLITGQKYGGLTYDNMPYKDYTIKSYDAEDNTYLCKTSDGDEYWLSDEMLELNHEFKKEDRVRVVNCNCKDYNLELDDIGYVPYFISASEIAASLSDYKNIFREDKVMTYHVQDGKRIDKTCNKQIDTKTTHVIILGGHYGGKATCDAENYDQRQGLLEAIANAVCNGNFDKYYNDDIKARKRLEKALCRCSTCGVIYDTPEEARACEQAHKDRKQAKLEKYLISKEAKRRIAKAEREDKIEELMKDLLKKKAEK